MRKVSTDSTDSVFEAPLRRTSAAHGIQMQSDSFNRRLSQAAGSRVGRPHVSILPSQDEGEPRESISTSLIARRKSTISMQQMLRRLSIRRPTRRFSSVSTSDRNRIMYENTYRMQPKARWPTKLVTDTIQSVLHERLKNSKYNPVATGGMIRSICEDVRVKVKQLCQDDDVDRRRIVCYVTLGQIIQPTCAEQVSAEAGVLVASRCLWNEATDKQSSCYFKNDHLWCTCTVFAVYAD